MREGYQQGYVYEYGSHYQQQNRPVYPPYGPEGDSRGYSSGGDYRYSYGPGYRAGAPPPPGTPPPAQPYPEYYRPPPPHQQSLPAHEYGGGKPGPGAANAAPHAGAPRRHPDFAKADGYPGPVPSPGAAPPSGAGTRFQGSWGPSAGGAAGSAFPRPPATQPPAAPWRPAGPAPATQPNSWTHQPYQPVGVGVGVVPVGAGGGVVGGMKRELTFPAECVESAVPTGDKRRRLTKLDVAPVDAWRIMMALKSGLLLETCWALDVLNILLFDDTCIHYFGLTHMPGLLDLLLEHFHKSLGDVFDAPPHEPEPWYSGLPPAPTTPIPEAPERKPRPPPDPSDRLQVLNGENYTMESRRRYPVTYRSDDELFAPEDSESETEGDRVDEVLEPWQLGSEGGAPHLMPCLRAEFLPLPFVRVLPGGRHRTVSPLAPATAAGPHAHITPSPAASLAAAATPATPATSAATPDPSSPAAAEHDPAEDNLCAEPMELEPERRMLLQVRDPAGVLKRRRLEDYEDECYTRDEPSLNLVNETRDALSKRCIALSNILRGLTFVPGNELEFSRSSAFLALAGKLLLLHHEHAPRAARARAYERAARDDADADACCSSLRGDSEWWWDTLSQLREDALVACANIAGGVELASQPEAVSRPLLDGLLHWSVCPAAVAGDAPPSTGAGSLLSPRRLALEALCKLCVTDANVDLVLATPPRGRIALLCAGLARDLCRPERPVVREFAVNLLHYLAGAGAAAAREVAAHAPAVAQLVAFIERAEQTALGVANQHGVGALRDNPDAMGTSLDMLRRAAATLLRLAEHPENRPLIRRHERRLLSLVMSQILDQKVAHELADVLYHCSQPAPPAHAAH